MNKVSQLLRSLSDLELRQALREIKELEETGVLKDGVTRGTIRKLSRELAIPHSDAHPVVIQGLFRIGSFKWAEA